VDGIARGIKGNRSDLRRRVKSGGPGTPRRFDIHRPIRGELRWAGRTVCATLRAMTLFMQLATATLVVAVTVLIHLAGLATLLAILRRHRHASSRWLAALFNTGVILLAAFGLFALHSVEIWTWAGVYRWLGVFPDLESALYFSTSTYVTIGYGDLVLAPGSRILGAIEGASGIILIGWSTAFFFSIVDRLKLLERGFENDRPE